MLVNVNLQLMLNPNALGQLVSTLCKVNIRTTIQIVQISEGWNGGKTYNNLGSSDGTNKRLSFIAHGWPP